VSCKCYEMSYHCTGLPGSLGIILREDERFAPTSKSLCLGHVLEHLL